MRKLKRVFFGIAVSSETLLLYSRVRHKRQRSFDDGDSEINEEKYLLPRFEVVLGLGESLII